MSLISGVNYKTGELNVPFVELDSIAQKQFSDREGDEKFIKYDDFLREVDKHFVNTMSLEEINQELNEIKSFFADNKNE